MTTLRARIADTLREHLSWTALESVNPVELADVLLSLPGIAIVELPEANQRGRWNHFDEICIYEGNLGQVAVPFYGWISPKKARTFAAALLAAAAAAEGEGT